MLQLEQFSPLALLKYIVTIFRSQSEIQKLPLSFESITFESLFFAE